MVNAENNRAIDFPSRAWIQQDRFDAFFARQAYSVSKGEKLGRNAPRDREVACEGGVV